jgi:hypothetical protein
LLSNLNIWKIGNYNLSDKWTAVFCERCSKISVKISVNSELQKDVLVTFK